MVGKQQKQGPFFVTFGRRGSVEKRGKMNSYSFFVRMIDTLMLCVKKNVVVARPLGGGPGPTLS